ncbi:MAG: hypothetical protein YK1309IOTA_530007 [Marine Group I thaumarchaeote]|nr:MAG: hypothetical protein YK1309IOTA_530007 [Marine Group I thaumarchaeote]
MSKVFVSGIIIAIIVASAILVALTILPFNQEDQISLKPTVFDEDGDGIVNNIDAFPQNPKEWDDFDFDGIGANEDTDDDNDGVLDVNDPLPSPTASLLTLKYLEPIEKCAIMDSGFPKQNCYRNFFVSVIEEGESSADIMGLVFFFAKHNFIEDCHFTAHAIGYTTFQKNPDLTKALMNGISNCRNGYFHGVLSGFFDYLNEQGKEVSNWYQTSCDDLVDGKRSTFTACIHGIGHGLVFYFEDDLKSSVDACKEIPEEIQYHCINGVMMQYTDNELAESESFESVIPEMCSKIPMTSLEKKICNSQVGRSLAFQTNHDLFRSQQLCQLLLDDKEVWCMRGAFHELLEAKNQFNEIVPLN